MKKTKITIERALRSTSPATIWKLISTAEGLSRWIAEEVHLADNELTFTWGKPGQEYETRKATILHLAKHDAIRFRWEDEDDAEAYTEIAMTRLDISNEYALCIVDFSEPDDIEAMTYMWNHDLDRLQHKTGI